MNIIKIQQLLQDEAFVNQLLCLQQASQVQDLFQSYGIYLSIDDINQAKDLITRYQDNQLTLQEQQQLDLFKEDTTGLLDDTQLEAVNGGVIGTLIGLTLLGLALTGCITVIAVKTRW